MHYSVRNLVTCTMALSLAVTPSLAHSQIKSFEGSKFEATEGGKNGPCPKSTFYLNPESGAGVVVAGLITTFVDKGFDALVKWLEARKERLSGTASARLVDEFYYQGAPKAKCYVFTSGTFFSDGTDPDIKVYAEFVPVYLDSNNAFTLKPVYLNYRKTVAQKKSGKGKLTSLAITYKYTQPIEKGKDGNLTAASLRDGGGFSFNFGKLKENTVLDHDALAGLNGGLAYVPTKWDLVEKDADNKIEKRPAPVAYEMSAMWVESAEPSPIYNTFVATVKDNKSAISPEVAEALRDILGLPDPK